jgi:hypothetical protein
MVKTGQKNLANSDYKLHSGLIKAELGTFDKRLAENMRH